MSTDVTELKNYFEGLASNRLSETRERPVNLHIGKKSLMYKYTIARFRQLLGSVDGDVQIAKDVIFTQFNAPEFKWKTRNSVTDLLSDWDAALAVVSSIREQEAEQKRKHEPFDEQAELAWKELFG